MPSSVLTIADLFCGAGGTSAGALEAAEVLGYRARLTAVNHWERAIATHTANHPGARHYCASLDALNPRELFRENELDLLWASPECIHHSNARGGRPINDQSRATAWCVVRWAEALRPSVIAIENVPEFESWGAIGENGRPLKSKRGATFLAWVGALESLGYAVDWRVLCAADYGDPTTRRRLFVQAVRGRRRIVWPEPTHAPAEQIDMFGTRKPWVSAREIIDWSHHGESIFGRKRPLSPKTMARIVAGLEKYGLTPTVLSAGGPTCPARPVADPMGTVLCRDHRGLAQPFLIAMEHGGRLRSIDQPLNTVTTAKGGAHGLASPVLLREGGDTGARCEPHLLPQHAGAISRPVSEPCPTVACAGAVALVEPFILPPDLKGAKRPVVTLNGERYQLDIRFRMLKPSELAAAQGFRKDYQFTGTRTEVVKQIGNAVPRNLARALVLSALSQRSDIREYLAAA